MSIPPENDEIITEINAVGISATLASRAPNLPVICHVKGNRNSVPYMPDVIPAVATIAPVKFTYPEDIQRHLGQSLCYAYRTFSVLEDTQAHKLPALTRADKGGYTVRLPRPVQ
ncbi:MAG: hypothetical protein ACYCZH_00815 [Sulfuriferula sp.]